MTGLKERPEDLKDLRQYGLDKPAVVATIGMGASTMTFELGKRPTPGAVWARDPSKSAVFSVNNGVAMELQKTVNDFGGRRSSTSGRSTRRDSRLRAAKTPARSSG